MKVWLLTVGEPLPIDPGSPRLLRCGIFASLLAQQGAEVVWWTSNFRHTEKEKRFTTTRAIQVNDNLKIWCLDSRPYWKNVSVQRILANRDVAAEFRRKAGEEDVPDIVIASYPIAELAQAAAEYARQNGIPSIIDIRDLWPDIWNTVLPKPLRWLGSVALLPFHLQSRRTLKSFSSICGITEDAVEWGLARAGRARSQWDRSFPLAYQKSQYSETELADARQFWRGQFEKTSPAAFRLCFFGIIRERLRIDVMVDAVRMLPDDVRRTTRLVICGEGPSLASLRTSASDLPQVIFPGWVNGPQIEVLASESHAGLLPYSSETEFVRLLPNKVIEYLAYGLPVLSSLRGPVFDLITQERCGRTYRETDPCDLARTIVELIDHPVQLREMSEHAKRVFRERFMASKVYGELAGLLAELAQHYRNTVPVA